MTNIRQKIPPGEPMGLFFPEVLIGCEREPSKYFLEYIFQSGFMGLFTFQIKIPRELLGIQADMFNPFTSSPGESITIRKKKRKVCVALTTGIWQNKCFHLQTQSFLSTTPKLQLFTTLRAVSCFGLQITRIKWLSWALFRDLDECSKVRKT